MDQPLHHIQAYSYERGRGRVRQVRSCRRTIGGAAAPSFSARLSPKYQQVELEYDDSHDGLFGNVQGVKVHGIRVTGGDEGASGSNGYTNFHADDAAEEAACLTDTEEDGVMGVDMKANMQDRQCI